MSLAQDLATARQTRTPSFWQSADGPDDLAGAFHVQAEVARLTGQGVAGWKTGFAPDGSGRPIAGPLLSGDLRPNGGVYRLAPGAWVIVELELAIRLGCDLPPGRIYSVDDILAASDEVLAAIELVGTRYGDFEATPFEAKLADNLNNAGFVAGSGRRDVAAVARNGMPLKLWRDGDVIVDQMAQHNDGEPLKAVAAFAQAGADQLGGLKAGQIVTTGSLNPLLKVDGPAKFRGELGGIGTVSLQIEV